MNEYLRIFAEIFGWMTLGGVVVFAALYLVGAHGGIIVPPELTPDEQRMVDEERLRELTEYAIDLTRPAWPTRRVRQRRIVGAMKERAS